MAFLLAEYKKQSQDPLRQGVIQTFIDNAPVLNFLKFDQINGGAIEFNIEKVLPTTGFRAINAPYISSEGEIETKTEALKVAGGKITVDRATRKMYGDARLATSIDMKVKSLARTFSVAFFKGDGTGDSFTGLQSRATTTIDQGTGALSLSNLRRAKVTSQGSGKVYFMGEEMYLRLSDAVNDPTLSNVTRSVDAFGNEVLFFAGVPCVIAGADASGDQILDFTETTSTTSIYLVCFDPNGVAGVQNGDMETYYLNQKDVNEGFDIEWLVNYLLQDPKSVVRVLGITDAPVVK